jgi:hypothetical protein
VNRTTKALVIVLLLAIVPLRGLAAVTVGFCAMGHKDAASHAHAQPAHDDHGHHAADHAPDTGSSPDCNVCAEHCNSASFAVPAPFDALVAAVHSGRIALGAVFAAGFVPDHLDPPPLAL